MNRTPSRRAVFLAALLSSLLLPAVFLAQSTGPKALVVCPPTDSAGCQRIAEQLRLTKSAAGTPLFPGGVHTRYEELRTMAVPELQSYSLVFVPSMANAPYGLLREDAVKLRLTQVLRGRVAVWSGTPDRGAASGKSAGKLTLIQNLARWAAGQYGDGSTGLVVLQDFSDPRPDGNSPRYDWVQGISGAGVTPDATARTYSAVERNTTNPAAAEIVGNLAYDNMASFGLAVPSGPGAVGAWGVTKSGKTTTRGQAVLVTISRAPSAGTPVGPAGGTVTAGPVTLSIPEGALSQTTDITIQPVGPVSVDGYVSGTAYSFGPDGLVFAKPATLTISYDQASVPTNVTEDTLVLFRQMNGSTAWEEIESEANASTNRVTGTIDGFSKYSVMARPPGVPRPKRAGSVTVTPETATVPAGNAQTLTAVVKDKKNKLLANKLVKWTVSTTGGSGGSFGNGLDSITTTTGPTGEATAVFTVSTAAGAVHTITATVDGKTDTSVLTVIPANDPPAAANDAYSVDEDNTLNVVAPGVLANDTDPESNPLTAVLATGPTNGTLTLNANGSFSYTPGANFSGSDSFTYRANDGTSNSGVATVTITVNPVNDAPAAVNDTYSTDEDVQLNVAAPGVLTNDTDADGNSLTAVLVTGPANGTLTLNANGSLTYTPNANFSGSDQFTYKANDGTTDSGVATVTINVGAVAEAPTAVNDAYSVAEDSTLTVAAPGVLANDTDPESDPLTAVLVTGPANGTLTLNANGSLTYTPNANFSGSDSFTYKANDGTLDSSAATVTITVNAVNDAPAAVNDAYSTDEDVALNVAAPGVLGNDTDVESSPLTAVLVSGPAHGTLTLNANGSFTYTPTANYNGPDSFTYKANDGTADSNVATVTITVSGVPEAPVAVNDAYSVDEDSTLTVAAPGVLGNDTDPEGGALTAVLVAGASNGTLTLNADGSFSYTPNAGFSGSDQFTYKANDGALDSNVATVAITVSSVNDAPTAVNDSYSTDEDVALNVAAPGVLGNDTDPESNPLTAVLVTGPANGTLTLNADGSLTYTPTANFNGSDSFTYRANDGTSNSGVATVTITVNSVVDPPTAVSDSLSVNEDNVLNVVAPGVLGNDSNPEGGTLTAVLVSTTTNGTLTLNADGSLTYTPSANFNGSDSFTYKGNNGSSDSNVATVTITVNPVNDLPAAVADAYSTDEDVALNVAAAGVLANDTDIEGNTLSAVQVTGPAHGTLTLNANGSFTYNPAANYFGSDQFTYKANDGFGDSNTVTVSITVNPVNDAPVAGADAYNAIGNVQAGIVASGVLANDSDVEGSPLSVVPATTSSANGGSVQVNADGSFTYISAAGFNGSDSFTYSVSDGELSSTGTVTMTVARRFWFVDASAPAGGDGRQTSKFQSLAPLNGAGGSGDPDQANDSILVSSGTYGSGIALEAGQGLLGQGIPADLTATVNGQTVTLLAAGSAPTIGSASGTTIQLASGNTVRGAAITSSAGAGIAGTTVGAATINNASVTATGGPALNIDGATNLAATLSSLSSTNSSAQGLRLNNVTAGSLTVSGATAITNPAGTGIDIQNSPITGSFAGTTVGKTASGTGVNLATNTGATFGFSSLGITTGAGAGLVASSTGTLNVTTGSISSTGGAAAQISSTASGMTFTSIASTNSGGAGLSLSSVNGSFSSGGTNIQNPTGIGVQVASSGATVGLANTTVNGSGSTGVSLTSNTGAITFADLDISPDAGQRALLATENSQTITATSGTIGTTGAGIPVEITRGSGTTPLAISLTTVSANGPLNGIKLSGTSGSFTVAGTGTASSGGTIQNTTGDAVSLNNASNVTLRLMSIQPDASGIMATNLSGTNVVERSVIDYLNTAPAGTYGLRMANTSTNSTLTLDGTTFQNKRDGTTAVSVSAMGNSVITFNVQDSNTGDTFESKFTNLFGSGIVVGAGDNAGSTAQVTANVSNSKFVNAPSNGINNLEMTVQQNATLVPNITNNQFDKVGLPLAVVGVINFNTLHSGRIGSNTASGVISGNTITNISSGAGPTFAYDPAGSNGYLGLRLAIENNVTGINHKVQILNNTFTGIARNGMYISGRGLANNINVKIDGNTVGTLAAPVGRANDRGIEVETQSASLLKIDVTNNPSIVNSGSSGSNSALHFRSGVDNNTTGNIQATVTGNNISNTNAGNIEGRFRAQTLGVAAGLVNPAGSMCMDLRNNVLENAGKEFEFMHESTGTFTRNVSGNTGTVTTTGAIGAAASCTRPTF